MEGKYKFVYVSLNKCPNVKGWMLKITPDELLGGFVLKADSALEEANDKWLNSYSREYFSNPHLDLEQALNRSDNDSGKGMNIFCSLIYHPMLLDSSRREGIIKALEKGETILINRNGGYSFLSSYTILDVMESGILKYPVEADTKEHIIISRYPGCKHYYLTSNFCGRIFEQNKFFTKKSAFEEAKTFCDESNITIKEDSFGYQNLGD